MHSIRINCFLLCILIKIKDTGHFFFIRDRGVVHFLYNGLGFCPMGFCSLQGSLSVYWVWLGMEDCGLSMRRSLQLWRHGLLTGILPRTLAVIICGVAWLSGIQCAQPTSGRLQVGVTGWVNLLWRCAPWRGTFPTQALSRPRRNWVPGFRTEAVDMNN